MPERCLFEGFKPEFWKGGVGGHEFLWLPSLSVCPRVVTRVLVWGCGGAEKCVCVSVCLFEGFKPECWTGGWGGHLLCVCPRVVTRVLVWGCGGAENAVCLFVQG